MRFYPHSEIKISTEFVDVSSPPCIFAVDRKHYIPCYSAIVKTIEILKYSVLLLIPIKFLY